jgi:hypothetical protein
MHDLREAFSPFYEADRATWAASPRVVEVAIRAAELAKK